MFKNIIWVRVRVHASVKSKRGKIHDGNNFFEQQETKEFIFENPSKGSMRHGQGLNTLETTLMSISMTAEVVS